MTYSGMAAGDHTTELIGVADNCSVQDSNPRIISVTTGATSQTTFDVVCFGPRKANSGESTAREAKLQGERARTCLGVPRFGY